MSGLGVKIEIGIDYRPCIVRVPAKIDEKEQEAKALFHCWNHRSKVIGESILRGGYSAGQVSATFAIMEFEDGTVHEVEPHNLRFVDNAMSEYAFPEMEKCNG